MSAVAPRLGAFNPASWRVRWPLWLELLLMGTTGGIQAAAYGADGLWWLQCLAVGVLAWRVSNLGHKPRRAALMGWVYASAWLGASVWWLYISIHDFGDLPAWMAATAVATLCGLLALYLALAMDAAQRVRMKPQNLVTGLPLKTREDAA